jgi:acyl-CoA synthetase (NDP forming)/GNAT superfamily N-acetyltransferase
VSAFVTALPLETIRHRFGGGRSNLTGRELERLVDTDFAARMSILAIVRGEVVGIAGYDRLRGTKATAEIAFIVADQYQRHGVATLLFESLAAYARRQGIIAFIAEVLGENVDMLKVFGATGLRASYSHDGGAVQVTIDLLVTREYLAACDAREAIAEAASVTSFLEPRSIAIVGAGRVEGNVGHSVVRSLLDGGYVGSIFPINPNASQICGLEAYPSLTALDRSVDLAIVAVPASAVPGVVAEAAALGVRALTIITAGFAETGRSGAVVESEMLNVARLSGMRIVGPNCLGVVNTDPALKMNATFAGLAPPVGRLAVISQSGAVGIVLVDQAEAAGRGLSCFVSVGNKLDVSSNDLLCYLEHDGRTSVIALYLESFGNPRKFARIARRVGCEKPIVALKAGRTSAGARGARSHTAAAATPEVTVSALLESAGVIKVERLEELLDVSAILLDAALPKGRRIGLVGNSGGPLILAADACEDHGLVVPELSDATKSALRAVVPSSAATTNPVDLTADGDAATLELAISIVASDPEIDAVIVVTTELAALSGADARVAMGNVNARSDTTVVACILGAVVTSDGSRSSPIAEIPSPERAAEALEHVCRYAEWRNETSAETEELPLREPEVVRQIVSKFLNENEGGGWLDLEDAARLLGACGLPVLSTLGAGDVEAAVAIANEFGYPIAMKVRSGSLVHKSDMGGVVLGLNNEQSVRAAYTDMAARLGPEMGGVIIQPMAPTGVEAIVGLAVDPSFGPVAMVGLGGVLTDLLGDHAFAVPPLNRQKADDLVSTLRAAPLLQGYRNTPVVDRAALVDLYWRVAALADAVPELVEMDLNPVVITGAGAVALDCKVRLAPLRPGPGPLFRALRPADRV